MQPAEDVGQQIDEGINAVIEQAVWPVFLTKNKHATSAVSGCMEVIGGLPPAVQDLIKAEITDVSIFTRMETQAHNNGPRLSRLGSPRGRAWVKKFVKQLKERLNGEEEKPAEEEGQEKTDA